MPPSRTTKDALKWIRKGRKLNRERESGPLPSGEGTAGGEEPGTDQLNGHRSRTEQRPFGLPSGRVGKTEHFNSLPPKKEVGWVKLILQLVIELLKAFSGLTKKEKR